MGQKIRLVMFGRQGAGKGTQCAALAEHFGVIHFSTGDALRAAVEAGTELGRQVGELINKGELIDDSLIIRLVIERLNEKDIVENGCILDGFPRTIAQSEALLAAFVNGDVAGGELDCVVHLEVPLSEVTQRMMLRGRPDDTEEGIARRLSAYEEETVPVLDWFDKQGLLVTVDGLGEEAVVTKRLVEAVELAIVDGDITEIDDTTSQVP